MDAVNMRRDGTKKIFTYPDFEALVAVIECIRNLFAISFSSWIVRPSGL